ncbi:MAG: UbiA family prenyltransferase [Planctomycetales bacterium]|nr:UbiA family prenyltransferase [Planctomycetales bacterium]
MRQLLAYLQLCRAANLFTALADIFLGFLMTHENLQPWPTFAWLLVSSACLYTAGMVWNDVFDRDVDREERPSRPIPSGKISVRAASILGTLLLVGGIVAAALAGTQSLLVAAILVACILAYDGLVKSTPVGPLFMGGCRFLNVMLGASAAGTSGDFAAAAELVWAKPQLFVAAALGIYITGVTWFAREEADISRRGPLGRAIAVVNLGLAGLIAMLFYWPDFHGNHVNIAIVLALVALTIDRRLITAWYVPDAQNVQFAIKICLLSLVMLDAALVVFFTGESMFGLAVVALLAPSLLLSRVLAMT